jgi:hypothetical protein
LLYGIVTWARTLTEERQLDKRYLHRIIWARWFHHIRNADIRRRTNQPAASLLLKVTCLRWFGHVVHKDPKRLLHWCPELVGGKRKDQSEMVRHSGARCSNYMSRQRPRGGCCGLNMMAKHLRH